MLVDYALIVIGLLDVDDKLSSTAKVTATQR